MERMLRALLPMSIVFLLSCFWGAKAASAATLKVSSFPSGAQVSIDGVNTGKVTPMNISLPEGDHVVTVQLPGSGWGPDTRTVTIVAGNNDLSVTLLPLPTPGPQGPPGPPGEQGEQGPPGPATSSLADLSGISCLSGSNAGQVAVTVAANGAISLMCVVATDPGGGLTPDAATAGAGLQFMLRAQSLPTTTECAGSFGIFGTGYCIQGSTSGFSLTPNNITVTGANAPFSFNALLNVSNTLFHVTYQILGNGGSCNMGLNGPVAVSGSVGFASAPGGPLTRVALMGAQIDVSGLSASGCGAAGAPRAVPQGLIPNPGFQGVLRDEI